MTVDLLLVNYNTKDLLKRFLDKLHEDDDGRTWTLSVADNGSTDDSVRFLHEHRDDYNIKDVFINENIGYSAAINQMAASTYNEFLCAVNADTWFSTNHVREMLKGFEDNSNMGVCGPKQLDEKGFIRHAGIFWPMINAYKPKHRGWSLQDPKDQLYKDLVECWTVSGSIYYVRRSVWDEAFNHPGYKELFPEAKGPFLPTPHFFEETFFSQMAHHLGHEVWYNGTAETAGHTWHASSTPGEASKKFFRISQGIYVETCDKLGIVHEC